jgi:PAS domain S-box-containing protein
MKGRGHALLLVAVSAFAAAAFFADWLIPLGGTGWVLFLPVILAAVWLGKPRHVILASAACAVLVVVSFVLGHPDNLPWRGLRNRAMGITAIALTAFAGVVICRRSARLGEVMRSLQHEIAHHEQTERALRESEERLRLAADGAGMGTWDANLGTGEAVWSVPLFRMLGHKPAPGGAAAMDLWWSRVHPDDRRRVLDLREQARRERSLYAPEYRIVHADTGAVVWLAVFGRFVYDEAGQAVRFLGVAFDITRRKQLEREVLEIAAREQRRIGQELHDGVGQELTGLGLMATALAGRLAAATEERRMTGRLADGLGRVHQQVRTLTRGLVPVEVEPEGLRAALEDLAARAREQSGVPVTFSWPESVDGLEHDTATQLFRIAQEAVSNALRHARPRSVALSLTAGPEGLALRVCDDGTGLAGGTGPSTGMGLRIMQYRAEQIGGTFHVRPADGHGTVVSCTLPRRNHDDDCPNGGAGSHPDRG